MWLGSQSIRIISGKQNKKKRKKEKEFKRAKKVHEQRRANLQPWDR